MEEQVSIIRRLVSSRRRAYQIQKVMPDWQQLCASMRAIGDTELAIDAYKASREEQDTGKLYLQTYGVLQCLYVQQDAVAHLCEVLGVNLKFDEYPSVKGIRDTRNESIGHPSRKKDKGSLSFHTIIRVSLDGKGFELLSRNSEGKPEVKSVSVSDCIDEQRAVLRDVLKNVADKLKDQEKEHKMEFKDEKLTESFGDLLYHCQSMYESISEPQPAPPETALTDIEMISGGIGDFQAALAKRDIELDTYDSLKREYGHIEFRLKRLRAYFENLKACKRTMQSEDAYVYWESLKMHIEAIMDRAKEIDEEYEDTGE